MTQEQDRALEDHHEELAGAPVDEQISIDPEQPSEQSVQPDEEPPSEDHVQEEAVEHEPEQSKSDSLLDFANVRPQIMAIIERNEFFEARQILEQISRFPDTTRHVPDNVWLYRTLGDMAHKTGEDDVALKAYEAAYKYDPRELPLLMPYAALLLIHDRTKDAIRVLQSVLLYHKRNLEHAELVQLYVQMGECYEHSDKPNKARISYEKALEESPGNMQALQGLLNIASLSENPGDVIEVRKRFIQSLPDAPARSNAMIALGDDFAERFNDPLRAIDMYEQALHEDENNRMSVERIAQLATQQQEWRKVSRAYFTLSRMSQAPEEEAEWLIKASLIARDQLWEPEKALGGFKKALDLDPSRLDAFKIVTSILVDTKDWEGLKQAYINLIAALKKQDPVDNNVLTVLWQKLGELYLNHLDNKREALIAFDQASQLLPQSVELHEKVAQLGEKDPDFYDNALAHLKALRILNPNNDALLDRIGRIYLRKKEVDQAYCIFRALAYRGAVLDDKASAFVERFQKPIYKAPKQPLTQELLKRYVLHPRLDAHVSRVFDAIKEPLAEWAGQTRQKHGLGKRDRIKISEQLTFNNIYRSIGELLQYPELPQIWRKHDQNGLINGALVPDGMIVGDSLLGSGQEKQVAFIIGKQLFLFLSSFYLVAIRPTDLQAYYVLSKMLAFPSEFEIPLDNTLSSAYKTMQKGVSNNKLDRLRASVKNLTQNGQDADIDAWREAVEDSANRAGFIFCDDLKVCEDYLNNEAQRISKRTVQDRMNALCEFAISEEYVELRSILGINVA